MNTKALWLSLGGLWGLALSAATADEVNLRQWVIRAPEQEVIDLLTGPKKRSDAELATALQESVKQGRAQVVSDLGTLAKTGQRASVQEGRCFWLPSELDQGFDFLHMTPESFTEQWTGTKLEYSLEATVANVYHRLSATWNARFSPRDPISLQWPTSWLRIYDHENQRPSGKAIHGWLDWRDMFEETFIGEIHFPKTESGPVLLTVLPPADQLWPGDRPGRWLDVFFAEAVGLKEGKKPSASPDASPANPRLALYAIGIGSQEALALTAGRDPGQDEALLQSLLARVREGRAVMRLCTVANQSSTHWTQTSARLHDYPTEMPSIPSAWDTRPVGTNLVVDENWITLTQDLAPPARTVWPLAGDMPEAVMWEPRFRGLTITGAVGDTEPGTRLVSLAQVPPVMRGNGMPEDETILLFTRRDAGPPRPEPASRPPVYELEILVAEVPAAEESAWQVADPNAWHESDDRRFQTLLDRVKGGQSPLIAHLRMKPGLDQNTKISLVEEYMTATEFDPPEPESPQRMRPTALETLPVGSTWEVSFVASEESPDWSLDMTFSQSTARPVEPNLAEMLVIAASERNDYRGAVHPQETWVESLRSTRQGARCLGTCKPPGVKADVRHVAFVRVMRVFAGKKALPLPPGAPVPSPFDSPGR